jgi:DNA-binding NarL/FixJ family response regulator
MKILVVDDEEQRHYGFASFYYDHELYKAHNVDEAMIFLSTEEFDLIQLDHDLQDFEHFEDGRKPIEHTGMDICSYLIKRGYSGKVIIHSWNVPASVRMKKMFIDAGINVLYEPYSHHTPAQK